MKTFIQSNITPEEIQKVISKMDSKWKGGIISTVLNRPVLIRVYKTSSACLIKIKKI